MNVNNFKKFKSTLTITFVVKNNVKKVEKVVICQTIAKQFSIIGFVKI